MGILSIIGGAVALVIEHGALALIALAALAAIILGSVALGDRWR